MRARMLGGLAVALGLLLPATASATATLFLSYEPPVIRFIDDTKVKTVEDLRLSLLSPDEFLFQNPPAHFVADFACGFVMEEQGYTCPRDGIERIVAQLGRGDDKARTSIPGYRQKLNGGSGDDQLRAAAGRQKLSGGSGRDLLKGGKGNDVLNGGPGNDTCRGGPGKDRLKSC